MDWSPYFPFPSFRPHQEETLDRAIAAYESGKRFVVVAAPTGCHARGTPILMYDGTIKKVEDINIGEQIMGPDSRPRKVLELHRGRQEMAKITPTKGEPFVVNKSHILSLQRTRTQKHKRNGKVQQFLGKNFKGLNPIDNIPVSEWLTRSRTYKHTHKLYRTGVEFSEASLPIPPYILGLWLGDGSSKGAEIVTMDEAIVTHWANFADSHGLKLTPYTKPNNRATSYNIVKQWNARSGYNQNTITKLFRDLGVIHNKHIPHLYLTASKQQRLELLAGLLDTDGGLCGGFDFIQKRMILSEQTAFLARSLGFAAYVTPCTKHSQNGTEGVYYRVSISGHLNEIPTQVPRKQALARKQKKNVLRTGFKVELLPEDDYFGFEVDGDHLYLLGDFTVTHNSGKSGIGIALGGLHRNAYFACPERYLQDQYHRDFENILCRLQGKSNYPCTHFSVGNLQTDCSKAKCSLNISKMRKRKSDPRPLCECPYLMARDDAMEADQTLLNFSNLLCFFMIAQKLGDPPPFEWFTKRPLLILDEAHKIEGSLFQFAEIALTKRALRSILPSLTMEQHDRLDEGLHSIDECVAFCADIFPNIKALVEGINPETLDPDDDFADAIRQTDKIDHFLQDVRNRPYVVKPAKEGCLVSPLSVEHLHRLAFSGGQRVLLMSATILDPPTFFRSLGIKESEAEFIDVPTSFPTDNRPFEYRPVGKMSRQYIQETLPKLVEAIKADLDEFSNHKGLIHTFNYKIANYIAENINDDRLIVQTPGTSKYDLLDRHVNSTQPTVLVGPGFAEGVDLKYELCRFIIFCKMPYMDLSDPVVKARLERDPDWYQMMTAATLLQMKGRGERAEDDWCVSRIHDACFHDWYFGGARHILPLDFHRCLRWR